MTTLNGKSHKEMLAQIFRATKGGGAFSAHLTTRTP